MKNFQIVRQIVQYSSLHYLKGFNRQMSAKIQPLLNDQMFNELNNYSVKLFDSKFNFKFDPLYWEAKHQWPKSTAKLLNNDRDAMNTVRDLISPVFVGIFMPQNKNVKTFNTLTNFIDWFFLFDDFHGIEKSVKGVEGLLTVIKGEKLPKEPLECLIDNILKDYSPNYREEPMEKSRLRSSIFSYVYKCLEALEDVDETIYKTIDEYFEESRMETIGVYPCINFIPYSTGINVEKYLSDKRLIKCENLINWNIIVTNDYYSFKKEMAKNEAHLQYNYYIDSYRKTHDLDKSYRLIQTDLIANEIKFLTLKSSLLKDYPNDTDLHKYIDGLEYICYGAYIWHLIAPRYKSNKIPIDCVLNDKYIDLKNDIKLIQKF